MAFDIDDGSRASEYGVALAKTPLGCRVSAESGQCALPSAQHRVQQGVTPFSRLSVVIFRGGFSARCTRSE